MVDHGCYRVFCEGDHLVGGTNTGALLASIIVFGLAPLGGSSLSGTRPVSSEAFDWYGDIISFVAKMTSDGVINSGCDRSNYRDNPPRFYLKGLKFLGSPDGL
ncbi:hypothetical protein PGTUg99_009028 [Puccinia graminis f. sp. tritici]|uniref:Uncharacterized protein n=1 Tax=Puccinia graminis f. sp. tritici TaxID=56615 RepID=A0A5B0RY39_PUCGR|nr:hypothetical protein PGTUg99_009028 [Puccinia graminis f. sp. tritici]